MKSLLLCLIISSQLFCQLERVYGNPNTSYLFYTHSDLQMVDSSNGFSNFYFGFDQGSDLYNPKRTTDGGRSWDGIYIYPISEWPDEWHFYTMNKFITEKGGKVILHYNSNTQLLQLESKYNRVSNPEWTQNGEKCYYTFDNHEEMTGYFCILTYPENSQDSIEVNLKKINIQNWNNFYLKIRIVVDSEDNIWLMYKDWGENYNILISGDEGENFVLKYNISVTPKLSFTPNYGYITTSKNQIKKLDINGEEIGIIDTPIDINSMVFGYDDIGIIASEQTLLLTKDGGASWETIFTTDKYIDNLQFTEGYFYFSVGVFLYRYKIESLTTEITESEPVYNYKLSQNYPNPFNPATTISFELPETANVKLTVYNNLGEQVAVIANNQFSEGKHIVNFNAENLTSGVYFYRLTTPNKTLTNKMVLLK